MAYECAVFLRLPNGKVVPLIEGNDGEIGIYQNRDDAIAAAETNVCVKAGWPFQVVEFDEL